MKVKDYKNVTVAGFFLPFAPSLPLPVPLPLPVSILSST